MSNIHNFTFIRIEFQAARYRTMTADYPDLPVRLYYRLSWKFCTRAWYRPRTFSCHTWSRTAIHSRITEKEADPKHCLIADGRRSWSDCWCRVS